MEIAVRPAARRADWLQSVFVLGVAVVSTCAPVTAGSLTLAAPVYSSCGVVSVDVAKVTLAASSDTILNFTWNWGDGTPASLMSFSPVTHKYSQDGEFTVQVTGRSLAGESAGASVRVTVNASGAPACAWIGPYYTATTVAGVDFAAGQTAPATALNLRGPWHLALDAQDNLYIGDLYTRRIWRVPSVPTSMRQNPRP